MGRISSKEVSKVATDKDNEPSHVIVDGKRLTNAELRKWRESRADLHREKLSGIFESRRAPGGHAPYWGTGHESLSASVPANSAREHADWIKAQGISGVEVRPDGVVVTSSPRDREKYLKARGLVDASSAGSGTGGQLTRNEELRARTKKPGLTKEDRAKIRTVAKQAVHDPELRNIISRGAT
jgi:hypothetical protein